MATEEREAWERQKRESDRAFGAFCAYRDLGPQRKIAELVRKTGISRVNAYRWSATYRWAERASAWDDHLDEVKRNKEEKAVAEMGERHALIAMGLQAKITEKLQSLQGSDIPASSIPQWLKIAVDVERLSRGVLPPTKVELTGKDGGPVQLGTWEDIVRAAGEEDEPLTEPDGHPG